jgi:hypothetical protein
MRARVGVVFVVRDPESGGLLLSVAEVGGCRRDSVHQLLELRHLVLRLCDSSLGSFRSVLHI